MNEANTILYLINFGYERQDAKRITAYLKTSRNEEKITIKSIIEINEFFKKLNYSHQEILEIGKQMPTIYAYSISLLNKKIDSIVSLGHPRYEIINAIRKYPQILNYSLKVMKSKNENLIKLGYKNDDILKMSREFPLIYKYADNNIEKKFLNLVSLGYTKIEVINMTKISPQIFSLLKKKLRNLDRWG